MPFAAAGVLFSGLMRSEGATSKAMTLQLAGITLNIVLDHIFISVIGWGTKGAAWATIAGQLASFTYGRWYFRSKKTSLSIGLTNNKANKIMLRELFAIGIPAEYDDYVVAAFGVQMRIASLCFMLVFALIMEYQHE
jgi:Na+-driven multidrug efflux pump